MEIIHIHLVLNSANVDFICIIFYVAWFENIVTMKFTEEVTEWICREELPLNKKSNY